ncbi:MAG: hypothetical protein ACFB16_12360 [Phormidesmis sp.]
MKPIKVASVCAGLMLLLPNFSVSAVPLSNNASSTEIPDTEISATETPDTEARSHNLAPLETPPPMPTELPGLVSRRIKRDLSRRINVPVDDLRIVQSTAVNWRNDCLDLAYVDESCQQKEVQGWNVEVIRQYSDNSWSYRSDRTGNRIRLDLKASSAQSDFSPALSQQLLQKASAQLQQPISSLSVGDIQAVTWNDGCLGLAEPDDLCTQAIVLGFRVIVKDGQRQWVYHISADGSQIMQNAIASSTYDITGIFLPNGYPVSPESGPQIIFQGQSYDFVSNTASTTMLSADGTVRSYSDAEESVFIWQISPEDVAAFESLLTQQNFSHFDQIGYISVGIPIPEGTYVMTGAGARVEAYYNNSIEMPEALRPVLEAWEEIASRQSTEQSTKQLTHSPQ